MTTCKHCSEGIRHFDGQLWHDSGSVFPQYCQAKYGENGDVLPSQLHEPAAPQLAPPFGKVQTSFNVFWSAYLESYDGAPDAKGPNSLVGHGKTESEAVAALLEQLHSHSYRNET